jgi:hypothetical protein
MFKSFAKKYLPASAIRVIHKLRNPDALIYPANDPDFIIIGAQKCGTSSLHYYLGQHPDIVGSEIKETHYFNNAIHFGVPHKTYRKYFKGKAAFHFEATPAYLYHPGTAEKIKEFYPRIKLIVLLREPGARAYSAWNHYRTLFPLWVNDDVIKNKPRREGSKLYELLFEGRQTFPTFRECLDIELELIKNEGGFEPGLLRRGLYLQQIEHYLQFFGESQMKLIAFKDFLSDKIATLNDICQFVNAKPIDWSHLKSEPKNKREYQSPMLDTDRAFLDAFYKEPNAKLFEKFGPMNW